MQEGVNYKIKYQIPGNSVYYQYSEEEKDFFKIYIVYFLSPKSILN